MKRLFIAEKPSFAKAIADVLGVTSRGDGYHICGDDVVAYAVGHLLELAEPQDYDPALAKWRMNSLPITPSAWILQPKEETKKVLKVLGQLLKTAPVVINAGDADNEGQLLIDQVLEHFKYTGPVGRLWTSAVDPASIKAALGSMKDNAAYAGYANAARARARADWMVGMNLSRAYTLLGQAQGRSETLSVGRVQSPTLGMVVRRDAEIASFKSRPYHFLKAEIQVAGGKFNMRWIPREDQPGQDEMKRLVDTSTADELVRRLTGSAGTITEAGTQNKVVSPPIGFSLTTLTVKANKDFGYSANQVLEACQALYEIHKVTSYPRVDCGYINESQHGNAPHILAALAANIPGVGQACKHADPSKKSPMWNDAKITAHHAIVPTAMRCNFEKLSAVEANIYQLIARQYIIQFLPDHEFLETKLLAEFAGERFAASGKQIVSQGWQALLKGEIEEGEESQALPAVKAHEKAAIASVVREDKKTKAPPRFNEGSLIEAMENIHTLLINKSDKAVMRAAEGIGTGATRAAIIEELKSRNYIATEGKSIVSTEIGRSLISQLPEEIVNPFLAAEWEHKLRAIEKGSIKLTSFVADQSAYVAKLVNDVKQKMPALPKCPLCDGDLNRIKFKNSYFWGCSNFKNGCKTTYKDEKNKPQMQAT